MLSRFHPIPERYGQTNGQTDGRTDRQNSYINILTRDKNELQTVYEVTSSHLLCAIGTIYVQWQKADCQRNKSCNASKKLQRQSPILLQPFLLHLHTSPELRTLFIYSRNPSSLISLSVNMKVMPLPSQPAVRYRNFRSSIRLLTLYDLQRFIYVTLGTCNQATYDLCFSLIM